MTEDEKGRPDGEGGAVLGKSPLDPAVYQAAVQMTRMPMVLEDPNLEDCPVVYCNDAFCEMTGFHREEVVGRNCRFLQGPGTDAATVRRIADALAKRQHVSEEIYNYCKDGRRIWVALEISPVFDADGTLRYFFGSQVDVTRRKEAEFLRAHHLESIGALCTGVAHEFNNLMTAVLGSVTQALTQAVNPRQRQRLERAAFAAQRAGERASHLLNLARRQTSFDGKVDVNLAIRQMHGILIRALGPEARIALDLAADPVVARLDRAQFELVLLSLVRNAAEAMLDGGTATIATSGADSRNAAAMVQIAVSDTGPGMSPDVQERATEAFFTTKRPEQSPGLGLFLTLRLAEEAGGRMSIESEPGRGTTVQVLVPLAVAQPHAQLS